LKENYTMIAFAVLYRYANKCWFYPFSV